MNRCSGWIRNRARHQKHKANPDRGSALVEFAIVAPILLLLLGIFQLGLATYRLHGVHSASRDGARIASYPTTTQAQVRDRVFASLEGTMLENTPVIAIEPNADAPCANAEAVIVTVTVANPYWIPFFGESALDLTSRAEFLCER